jgi:hypothetical protein
MTGSAPTAIAVVEFGTAKLSTVAPRTVIALLMVTTAVFHPHTQSGDVPPEGTTTSSPSVAWLMARFTSAAEHEAAVMVAAEARLGSVRLAPTTTPTTITSLLAVSMGISGALASPGPRYGAGVPTERDNIPSIS